MRQLVATVAASIVSQAELLVALVGPVAPAPAPRDETAPVAPGTPCTHPAAARRDAGSFGVAGRKFCVRCQAFFTEE